MFTNKGISIPTIAGDNFRDTYCIEFDGTDEFIDLGDYSNWDFSNGSETVFTFSMWVKANNSPGNLEMDMIITNYDDDDDDKKQYFIAFRESSSNDHIYTRIRKGTGTSDQAATHISQQYALKTRGTRLVTDWNHYCFNYDGSRSSGSETKVYINGMDSSGGAGFGNPTIIPQDGVSKLTLGARQNSDEASGYDYYGDISISDLAIYNVALTGAQCATIWNSYDPFDHINSPYKSNLVAYYRFGDTQIGSSTNRISQYDNIGSGAQGLLVNQVTFTQPNKTLWDSPESGDGDDAAWTTAGSNALATRTWGAADTGDPSGIIVSGEVKITYSNNAAGASVPLTNGADLAEDLIIGTVYQVKIAARSNTGTFQVVVNDGTSDQVICTAGVGDGADTINDYIGYFRATHATNCVLKLASLASGQIAYLTKFQLFKMEGNGHGLTGNMESSSIIRHQRYRS